MVFRIRSVTAVALAAVAFLCALAVPSWAGPPPLPWPPPRQPVPLWVPPAVTDRWPPALPVLRASSEAAVIAAVNRYRDRAGCPPVHPNGALGRAARRHSADMARHGRLSHTGSGGSTTASRLRAAGYRFGQAGENITAGPATPKAAVEAWMDSPPHRSIVLNCEYDDAGAGVRAGRRGSWWTLVLASAR
ncbi:CAP domain-containing protein [Streptomyces sp. NPDC005301]|uniref:CAP domain-containing protein n=1 Tax=Streptomyces sp. NPDC005301 TaxID=3156874 RepID=UPI00339F69CD